MFNPLGFAHMFQFFKKKFAVATNLRRGEGLVKVNAKLKVGPF